MTNRIDIRKHVIENFLKCVKAGKTHIRKDQLIDPEYRDIKIGMKSLNPCFCGIWSLLYDAKDRRHY